MKKYTILMLFAISVILISCGEDNAPKTNLDKPKDFKQKMSFMIGYDMGSKMINDSLEPDIDYFVLGLQLGMKHDTNYINPSELKKIQGEFQNEMMKKQQIKQKTQETQLKEQGKVNIVKANQFLEENKKKPGVVTTPSGLQYQVITEGNGPLPKTDEMVKVHIKASFIDGKEFDNTINREPPVLPVDGLIPGWKEALSMMKVGSTWKLFVPPNLAYGEMGLPPQIPPNSVLIFEVQLISIQGKIPADHPARRVEKPQQKN